MNGEGLQKWTFLHNAKRKTFCSKAGLGRGSLGNKFQITLEECLFNVFPSSFDQNAGEGWLRRVRFNLGRPILASPYLILVPDRFDRGFFLLLLLLPIYSLASGTSDLLAHEDKLAVCRSRWNLLYMLGSCAFSSVGDSGTW